jgi:hypothetical protein
LTYVVDRSTKSHNGLSNMTDSRWSQQKSKAMRDSPMPTSTTSSEVGIGMDRNRGNPYVPLIDDDVAGDVILMYDMLLIAVPNYTIVVEEDAGGRRAAPRMVYIICHLQNQ